uniref:Uncharacterized protein n=1 Tax=Triticum urartu TaxID=4572 RepID=A0A8R7QD55_TRIUA
IFSLPHLDPNLTRALPSLLPWNDCPPSRLLTAPPLSLHYCPIELASKDHSCGRGGLAYEDHPICERDRGMDGEETADGGDGGARPAHPPGHR